MRRLLLLPVVAAFFALLIGGCGDAEPTPQPLDPGAPSTPVGESSSTAAGADVQSTSTSQAPTPTATPMPSGGPERLRVEVLEERTHDTDAFTEGLVLADGVLFESTGGYGESELRAVDPLSGEELRSVVLDDELFGEGLALVGDQLVQLTWREGEALVYTADTFERVGTFAYEGEGWGLCSDGTRLVMSDGSATLHFRSYEDFAETGSVEVTLDGEPLPMINELECVGGDVWANVWRSEEIVRIDPSTGEVTAVVDASGLVDGGEDEVDVLNGIAYDEGADTFLITGKWWPTLFEVRFVNG